MSDHFKLKAMPLTSVFLLFSLLGCKNAPEHTKTDPTGDFMGLYTVDYQNMEMQYIWIFTENMRYVLYPGKNSEYLDPNKSINYETPTHYYIEGTKFYACGVDSSLKAVSLSQCKGESSDPRYNIVSIDTVENEFFKKNYQVIVLEDHYTNAPITLKKRL